MEQINVGGNEVGTYASTRDICLMCDWNPSVTQFEKKKDLCACCDCFDWVESDE